LLWALLVVALVDAQSKNVTTNQQGTDGGYFYSFWTNGGGSVYMTLDGKNGYTAHFTNAGDFTCGKGWNPGTNRAITFTGSYSNSGGGAFGVYGWSTSPLVEYYIAEAPGNSGGPAQGTHKGTVTSDGGTYDIWEHEQINQPSIIGTANFSQYISLRQAHRTSGTITVQKHINALAGCKINVGTKNYQILLTEGWNGSGNSSVTLN